MAKLSFIRHWEAKYEDIEHKNKFEWAHDIKPETLKKLSKQAKEFSNKLNKWDTLTVWSSPIPRALETANVFIKEIESDWHKIRSQKIFKIFEEVKWFKWIYLKTLVDGGEITIWNKVITIYKKDTNPLNLKYWEYFRQSYYKKLDEKTLSKMWDFWVVTKDIESYKSVFNRIFRELARISKLKKPLDHILIFTHQCNTDFLVELLNDYKYGWINPWENITLVWNWIDFEIVDFPQANETNLHKDIIKNSKTRFEDILRNK